MRRRRLTGADAVFLAAERPANYLHMMGLLVLDPTSVPGGYRFESFRQFLAERLHVLPPLRRRLLEVPGGLARPYWVEEPHIDLDLHLRRAAVPSPGGLRELSLMAAEMMERPLDRRRPLWEMSLVEGLEGGQIALFAKLHHATMDGLAGVKLMASLFSTTPEVRPPPEVQPEEPDRIPGRLELLAGAVPWLARQPRRAAVASWGTARSVLRRVVARSAATREEEAPELRVPRSWLNARITPYRSIACRSLPLSRLRAVGRPLEATLNDVLLAVMAGALRRYGVAHDALPHESLVAGVPIAVRDENDERANAVSSVSVGLGTDLDDPEQRLVSIRDGMRAHKRKRRSTLGEDLSLWANVPPPLVFSLVANVYLDFHLAERMDPLCNLVVSSVPGPPQSLYLAGARVAAIHPLGPIYSGIVLNVTAMSGAENLDLGLVACRGRMPDLWDLADAIPAALEELEVAVSRRRSVTARGR